MGDIAHLNGLTKKEAVSVLMQCCGSMNWAEMMVEARPFQDIDHLFLTADRIWWSVAEEDWLEAFSSHPKIGEKTKMDLSESARWAEEEQSSTSSAADETLGALAKANHDYQKRFGFIFIVCATGKSADEMLALLIQRLPNKLNIELRIAAEEQRRITHLRLDKLLSASP